METKYFLIEWSTNQAKDLFLNEVVIASESVAIFPTEIGRFILKVKAVFDPNCEIDRHTDPTDVMHKHRNAIKTIKEYYRNPAPQKHWTGQWINISPIS